MSYLHGVSRIIGKVRATTKISGCRLIRTMETDLRHRPSSENFYFSLRILDARTHFVLGAFSSNVPQAGNRSKSRQFFDQAMTALVDDVKKLAQPVSTVSAPAKN